MYEGTPYIKIYENSSCSKEPNKGVTDYYKIRVSIPTGNKNEYSKAFYIKNVGSHVAYNVKLNITQDTTRRATFTELTNKLDSGQVHRVNLVIPFTEGEVGLYSLGFDISYDCIP